MARSEIIARLLFLPAIMLLVLCQSIDLHSQTSSGAIPPLEPPYKVATYSNQISTDPPRSAPYYDHGYLIQLVRGLQIPSGANVFLYDSSGNLAQQLAIKPAGTAKIILSWAAIGDRTDKLIVTGQSTSDKNEHKNFVAISSIDGASQTYFFTGRYIPMQVCQASDGTIWTVGTVIPRHDDPPDTSSYARLRHYSSNGSLLDSLLPHSSSVSTMRTAWAYSSQVYLRASPGLITLYDGPDSQLYQLDLSTKNVSSWNVANSAPSTSHITGFGISATGDIYASMIQPDAQNPQTIIRGLFILTKQSQNTSATWVPVPGTVSPNRQSSLNIGSLTYILGVDGDDIVYRLQQSTNYPIEVAWSHR
jgi:hypothetical protein